MVMQVQGQTPAMNIGKPGGGPAGGAVPPAYPGGGVQRPPMMTQPMRSPMMGGSPVGVGHPQMGPQMALAQALRGGIKQV